MSEVLDTDETMYQNGGRACWRKRAASDAGVEAALGQEHQWLLMERVTISHIYTKMIEEMILHFSLDVSCDQKWRQTLMRAVVKIITGLAVEIDSSALEAAGSRPWCTKLTAHKRCLQRTQRSVIMFAVVTQHPGKKKKERRKQFHNDNKGSERRSRRVRFKVRGLHRNSRSLQHHKKVFIKNESLASENVAFVSSFCSSWGSV